MPVSKNSYLESERSYCDFCVATRPFWRILKIFFIEIIFTFYLTFLRKNMWKTFSPLFSFRTVNMLGFAYAARASLNSELSTNPWNPRWRILYHKSALRVGLLPFVDECKCLIVTSSYVFVNRLGNAIIDYIIFYPCYCNADQVFSTLTRFTIALISCRRPNQIFGHDF